MALNSIEIQIFVSCPKDVNKEKGIVAKVCERVNKNLLSSNCNIHLTFRDFSEIIGKTGERLQQIINDNITGYDIYLGLLHMRFGTPTGANNPQTDMPYESGTEEEFFIATDQKLLGKGPSEIYFFFKKQTAPNSLTEHEQAGKVLAFREKQMANNWVNKFNNTSQFEKLIMDLLTRISTNLCINNLKEAKHAAINALNSEVTPFANKVDISNFVPEFSEIHHYIHRSISQPQKSETFHYRMLGTEIEKPELKDLVEQEKRIVLLGNAGSGKSVELQQTAKYFLDQATPFISVYKRFNTYTDENIEDFLPKGWNEIDPNVMLLLLDGLDEIQPQHFNTAVRKLIDFSERNLKIRLVISSRTNFYELPNESYSGTLTGFKVFVLNDISIAEIKTYTEKIPNLDWEKFIDDIYNQSFLDLVQKPFFLDILIKYYIKNGNFNGGRLKIIEDSLLSMIEQDKEHYKTTIDLPKGKKAILDLLERVAFVMEVMGKNFITDDELDAILPLKEDYNQIKRFSTFAKNPKTGYWMFEHNNIQEFLASAVLKRQPFDKLIKAISFPPLHNRLKPTWVNTLSFFISTSEKELRIQLINWLVDKDKEIIVKFEPDRIDKNLRTQIFKQIFNFYKEKEIWLSSNKFNNNELTQFASFAESIEFLVSEIQNSSNTRINRLNAISLIDNYNLQEFEPEIKVKIKTVLIALLEIENADAYMIHQVLYALGNLKITDKDTVDHFVNKYSKRKNQYVRAGLYKLINCSEYIDQFADLFLEGLNLAEMEDAFEDRESTNLMDESWQLREGLSKMKSKPALKKIFSNLNNREDRRRINRYDNKDVIESILKNAFENYNDDDSLYDDIYDVFVSAGAEYEREYALQISVFFERSNTRWKTFLKIWNDDTIKDYDKWFLLELLMDKEILGLFIKGYGNRDFTNQNVEEIYEVLIRNFAPSDKNFELVELLENDIKLLSGPVLQRPQYIDWTEVNKRKAQESFNLLFNKEDLLIEIKRIFTEIGKDELERNDLWKVRGENYLKTNDYFISSALELVRDFTSNERSINYYEIAKWMTNEDVFEKYKIDEIYQVIHGNKNEWVQISTEQLEFITTWCLKISNTTSIEKAIVSKNNGISINNEINKLWFFINELNIILPTIKILEFTLFYDFERQGDLDKSVTIKKIENFVDKQSIAIKVCDNLSKSISEYHVWSSNAIYAIDNNIKTAYPFILRDLKNPEIRKDLREQVLDLYFKQTKNLAAMHEVLINIGEDELRWKAIPILISNEDSREFLLNYLKKIISDELELLNNKLSAARFLTQLNDLAGFNFIAEIILEKRDPNFEYSYRMGSSAALKDPETIPTLLELLKLAKKPEFKKDHFNDLESYVLDALYHIGIQSEENFVLVSYAINNFISENENEIEHLNFLHYNIEKIESQLYLTKSQKYTVKEAITEYDSLNNS